MLGEFLSANVSTPFLLFMVKGRPSVGVWIFFFIMQQVSVECLMTQRSHFGLAFWVRSFFLYSDQLQTLLSI